MERNFRNMAGTLTPFNGCIRDLVLNGNLINMGDMVEFNKADIGFCVLPNLPQVTPTVTMITPEVSGITPPVNIISSTPSTGPPTRCAAPAEQTSMTSRIRGAFKFGLTKNSHMTFKIDPDDIRDEFSVKVDIRTFESDGLVFYIARNETQVDFASIQLEGGLVKFMFDNKEGKAEISSTVPANDGKWHMIEVIREGRNGTLTIDGRDRQEGKSPEGATTMDVTEDFFLGGVPISYTPRRIGKLTNSMEMCVRMLEIQGELQNLATPATRADVGTCYQEVTGGSYFAGTGYAVLDDSYRVGQDMEVVFEFRTNQREALLLSVSSERTDALAIELKDGKITFRADNGPGPFEVTYNPEVNDPQGSKFSLCDMKFHKVEAGKVKNVLELRVDGIAVPPATSQQASTSADTKNPLYIGGYPDSALEQKAATTNKSFKGCIRNLSINGKPQDLGESVTLVDVQANTCPGK